MTQRRSTGRFRRRLALAGVAIALVGTIFPASAAAYPTSLRPGDSELCYVSPGDRPSWISESTKNNAGSATFYERGEILEVTDTASNGWRTVALFSWCEGGLYGIGTFRSYLHRDSGPNEGPTDVQRYDFEFAEGRMVLLTVCEKKDGRLRNCSPTVRMGSA
ncbi:hypothetical protein [Jiangella endophytica]|uniref:hypothetical protein n=1 Tax=Jiangella endophytica TaxID=1623398 RepID=UPI00130083D8|nr:hypothetical protein [Jiangella endophytica]